MAPKRTWQPLITASKWSTAWQSTAKSAKDRYGSDVVETVDTPRLSNGDAITLVKAWSQQTGTGGFPLWYQFAAAGYGWDPSERHGGMAFDALNTTEKQRASMLDIEIVRELWAATAIAARALDDSGIAARLELDADAFENPVFQASVKAALKGDGGMRAQFKIPIGCKDPKTGKATGPKLKCREGFDLEPVEGTGGLLFVCKNKKTGESEMPTIGCEGETITIDDPITGVKKDLVRLALILGFIWLVVKHGDE
jgi:hypothetical protein